MKTEHSESDDWSSDEEEDGDDDDNASQLSPPEAIPHTGTLSSYLFTILGILLNKYELLWYDLI